jgi:hypothetical protein
MEALLKKGTIYRLSFYIWHFSFDRFKERHQ